MMKKIAYTNTGPSLRFVGGQMVAPTETIYIDERDHPDYKAPPTQRPRKEHSDPVLVLLDKPVAEIIPELPNLSDEDFDKLQQAERDGNKTRKSLIKAFDEEFLRRAEAKVDGQKDDEPSE